MNKKFFTLIAGALMLAASLGTANAQITLNWGTVPTNLSNGGKYQMLLTTRAGLEAASGTHGYSTYVDWVNATWTNANAAQSGAVNVLNALRSTTSPWTPTVPSLLYYGWVDEDGILKGDPWNQFKGKYFESIFCLRISQNAAQGQNATLEMISWANKFIVQIDPSIAQKGVPTTPGTYTPPKFPIRVNEGYLGNWGYSNTYSGSGTQAPLQHWRPLYTYVAGRNDSVYVFVADFVNNIVTSGGTTTNHSPVKIQRIAAADLYNNNLPNDAILVEFMSPAPVVLSAEDFNTKLGSVADGKSQKLTFKGDYGTTANPKDQTNFVPTDGFAPWRDVNVTAIDVDKANTPAPLPGGSYSYWDGSTWIGSLSLPGNANGNWLYFKAASGANSGKFLRLDTAYYGVANDNLKYAWGDTLSALATTTYFTALPTPLTPANTFPLLLAKDKDGNVLKDENDNDIYVVDTTGLYRGRGYVNAASDFINQYRFQATYFWANDSLAIDIAEANLKPQVPLTRKFNRYEPKYWSTPGYDYRSYYNPSARDGGASVLDERYLNRVESDALGTTPPAGSTNPRTSGDFLHVKLVDLIGGKEGVLTIGDRPIRTRIKFNMESCTVQDNNLTSIPEGVYIIRNASKNMLLQVPIYSDTTALWVSKRDNVNPMHMPSYQWVVRKINTSNPNSSAISITNREFPNVSLPNERLYTDKKTLVWGEDVDNTYSTRADWNHADRSFQHVEPAALNNKWLGYYHVDNATAKVSKFDLNYYNLWLDKQLQFINKGAGATDTSLVVEAARTMQFTFVPQDGGKPRYYGYVPTRAEVTGLGIDTMWRVAYELKTKVYENNKAVEKFLVINKEHRYVLSTRAESVSGSDNQTGKSTFLFKANNWADNIDEVKADFYAMLDTTSKSTFLPAWWIPGNTGPKDGTGIDGTAGTWPGYHYDLRYVKLGVPEDTKWIYEQVQDEQRTSAFAVTSYTPPLYRRFDTGTYKAFENETEEVVEKYGDTKDSPLYLKFTRQNNYGYEFLAENSPLGLGNNNPGGIGGKYDSTKVSTTVNDYRQELSAYGAANTSFLGYYNIGQYPEQAGKLSYDFYVDTAYTRRPAIGSNSPAFTPKPQYMLAIRAQAYPESKIIYDGSGHWHYPDGTPVPGFSEDTEHREVDIPAFTTGFYLYNAQDSVNVGRGTDDFLGKAGYGGKATVRLAFVRGFHVGDTFYVIPNEKKYNDRTDLDLILSKEYYLYGLAPELKHYLGVNTHYEERYGSNGALKANTDKQPTTNGKAMVFQFRLIKDMYKDRRFLIETQTADINQQYGPDVARWLRIENGVPFLTAPIGFYEAANDPHNGADVFNVEAGDGVIPASKDQATAIEATYTNGAKVIGGTGSVTILNAAGKTVTVTNVLGQTVAKTVVSGNNASISLPKGIVVVSIDGTSSKALVK
jgi:hypothetical protein